MKKAATKLVALMLCAAMLALLGCSQPAAAPGAEHCAPAHRERGPDAGRTADAPAQATGADRYAWDKEVDVVVVGFGLSAQPLWWKQWTSLPTPASSCSRR